MLSCFLPLTLPKQLYIDAANGASILVLCKMYATGRIQSLEKIGCFMGNPQQGSKDYVFQSHHSQTGLDTINSC